MAPRKSPTKKPPKVRRRKDGTFRKGVSGNPGGDFVRRIEAEARNIQTAPESRAKQGAT